MTSHAWGKTICSVCGMRLSVVVKFSILLVVKISHYTESLTADGVADYKAKLTLDNGIILPDLFSVDKSQRVNDVTHCVAATDRGIHWPLPTFFSILWYHPDIIVWMKATTGKHWTDIITLLTVMCNKFCCICHMSMTDAICWLMFCPISVRSQVWKLKKLNSNVHSIPGQPEDRGDSDSTLYMHGRVYKISVLLRVYWHQSYNHMVNFGFWPHAPACGHIDIRNTFYNFKNGFSSYGRCHRSAHAQAQIL